VPTDSVADFVQELRRRGLTFMLRNNRLSLWPQKAWKMLTDEERDFIRRHREELKAVAGTDHILEVPITGAIDTPNKWTTHNDMSTNKLDEHFEPTKEPEPVPEPQARGCRETLWG